MAPRVGLVIVSHSDLLARGVVEVASQMAPAVTFAAAGGLEDGGIGTSYDRVEAALEEVRGAVGDDGGVVLLSDLGSATMTIESVLDFADDPDHLVFVEAPLVEGAVAAAVRAELGDDVAAVARAARAAASAFVDEAATPSAPDGVTTVVASGVQAASSSVEADAVVADPVGLHARPAAMLARLAASFDAEVTVNGADAASVLEVMALGVKQGESVHLVATGAQAQEAVDALVAMVEGAAD